MNAGRVRTALFLDPLDPLFFGGGRSLPWPQTLSGAVRTAVLEDSAADLEELGGALAGGASLPQAAARAGAPDWWPFMELRGPWFARTISGTVEVFLPVPASLERALGGEEWFRRDPLREPPRGWRTCSKVRVPLWRKGDQEIQVDRPGGVLTLGGIRTFLRGGTPKPGQWVAPGDLFDHDRRTCARRDATAVFGTSRLALRPGYGLYAEVLGHPSLTWAARPMALGGKGGRVAASVCKPLAWGAEPAGGEGTLYYLASPGLFGTGWIPALLEPHLVAGAAGRLLPVSGWDLARRAPKPVRFAVPAGAVYFTQDEPGAGASLCEDPELVRQGWGHVLKGTWNHAG